MANLTPRQVRRSSRNALKTIYYVIIGLAIIEALYGAFLRHGSFIGLRLLFERDNFPSTILFFALLPTICRFVNGASIHFDMPSDKRYKTLYDSMAFFTQASLFYLMAVSLKRPTIFSLFFGLMLLSDAFWLIFLWIRDYIELSQTEKQWLRSDFFIIGALILLYIINKSMAHVGSLVSVTIIAVGATIRDYRKNKDFYFPMQKR